MAEMAAAQELDITLHEKRREARELVTGEH